MMWFSAFVGLAIGDTTRQKAVPKSQIQQLIRQLGDAEFSTRDEATKRLAELGRVAIPWLERTAEDPDLEVRNRSLQLLKANLDSVDKQTKGAAKDALQRLSRSEDKKLREMAKRLLDPPEPHEELSVLPIGHPLVPAVACTACHAGTIP